MFTNVNVPSLDVRGRYAGTVDCSYLTGIPGTCTETGFSSQGTITFFGDSRGGGTYKRTWQVPALTFTGQAALSSTLEE